MNNSNDWKKRLSDVLNSCQGELKKTTEIGRKMLAASRRNSELKEAYEMLGLMAMSDVKNGKMQWNNTKAMDLIKKIEKFEEELQKMEGDVQDIKADRS